VGTTTLGLKYNCGFRIWHQNFQTLIGVYDIEGPGAYLAECTEKSSLVLRGLSAGSVHAVWAAAATSRPESVGVFFVFPYNSMAGPPKMPCVTLAVSEIRN
jgi:hypothetical protein